MSDHATDARRPEASDDRLLRFFVATERLLQAADVVRQAGDALVTSDTRRPAATDSEVQHDA